MFPHISVKCVPQFHDHWSVTKIAVSQDEVAEDVVVRLAQDLQIAPISCDLFALLQPRLGLWLSPNQNIVSWVQSEKEVDFELRLRFKPSDLDLLKRDGKAFDYYFFQIRYDFRKRQRSSNCCDDSQRVRGLYIADIVCHVRHMHPHLSHSEAEEKLKKFDLKGFVPLPIIQRWLMRTLNRDYRQDMLTAWNNSRDDETTPKHEYIRSLVDGLPDSGSGVGIEPLWPDYHAEQYKVRLFGDAPFDTVVDFQPLTQEIRVGKKSGSTLLWTPMCSVEELCFISVRKATRTVEISRVNGIPNNLTFETENQLKSFVSLLDGYYRLSQKWSFSICKDISSPSLSRLKQIKCHGPFGRSFAIKKLKEKADGTAGTYLLRKSGSSFSDLIVDVCCGHRSVRSFRISTSASGFTCDLLSDTFSSLPLLLTQITVTDENGSHVSLQRCIPSSENDQSDRVLMCRLKSAADEVNLGHNSATDPVVFKSASITELQPLSEGRKYGVYTGKLRNKTVVIKRVRLESETVAFLRTANDWIHLKSDCLILMRGVVMSPPSLVMEYYSLGPLDQFLLRNQSQLKPVDLIEAATYGARALWDLEAHGLVHGSIRCHNLLVAAYSPSTLKVKLSDSLSNNDGQNDAYWISPQDMQSGTLTAAGDVWSFGTTLWQIFCFGRKPLPLKASDATPEVEDLVQPFGCPAEVWDLVRGCWELDPEERKKPQVIVRDISQILYEVYNSRRTNCYTALSYTKMDKSAKRSGLGHQLFGSSLSLRSSIMSTSTLQTGLGSSRSDLISLSSTGQEDMASQPANESWLIEAHQLSLSHGKILGQGCYGEVVKAVLTKFCGLEEEVVAVKRINQNVPVDAGLRDMQREIEIMKKLSHRNIVEIKGFVEDPQLMLVMEYMKLGSLVSYLKVQEHRMLQQDSVKPPFQKFALDIVNGMEYLASMKIVHRDLAARNILVASETEVKISDFGLAQVIREGDYYRMRTQQCLPLRWYAPESIRRGTFTHKSDVWSFGVTLWEMYSFGKDPVYPECDHESKLLDQLEEGKRLQYPENCPLAMYEIMRSCWTSSPEQRPSFQQLEFDIKAISDQLS